MARKSKQKTIPLYWLLIGSVFLFYNHIYSFVSSFGLKEAWQVNFVILGFVVFATYGLTPYIDSIVYGTGRDLGWQRKRK